jgi:hypothetical protein
MGKLESKFMEDTVTPQGHNNKTFFRALLVDVLFTDLVSHSVLVPLIPRTTRMNLTKHTLKTSALF